jgi:predicted unusual protein kinase regulating ubiquinone biosynthesis (AarF/ABC1/UbiB family)
VIRFSLPILMQFVDDARSFSLETLADEFDKTIREEMDYERERRMLADIKANFADDPKIRIPDVLESHSTGRVLTMEYVPGTKINRIEDLDALGVDRTELARRLQEAYLQMLIVDGSFHADPHPGNLAVQDDGTLVFYDFGMSGRVDEFVQGKIVQFYGAVARQDIDAILDTLVELGTLSPDADRQLMSDIMELAIQDARGEDIEQYRVNQIVSQVEDTIYEFPLRLPPNMALVLRVATVVEGVCVTLDPDFDFIDVATDYLRDHGFIERGVRDYVEERAEALQESTRAALRTPPKLEEALDRINRESLTLDANIVDEERVIDRLARRIILGLLLTGTVVSTAILWAFSDPLAAGASLGSAIVVLGLLYRSFRRRRGIRATPQFTRQNLRQRREE